MEAGKVDVEKIDKAVAFLWKRHAEGKLLPDFVELLRSSYKDKAGWDFVQGPGYNGWEYFVDKVTPLNEAVIEGSLLTMWGDKPFAGKYVRKPEVQKWRADARVRLQKGHQITQQGDSSRMLKLSNIGQSMKPKLFKLLVKFGLLEYWELESTAGGNFTCYTQFKDAGDSGKLVDATSKTTKGSKKQQGQFQASFDTEGMLRLPSPILRLSTGSGPSSRKVSDIDLKEIGTVFSLFTTKPPSVEHERHQFGGDYSHVFITYHNSADAESALEALQKPLTDDFNFELVYVSEDTKVECINEWRKAGSDIAALHWGGDRLKVRDMGCDEPLTAEGTYLTLLDPYKVMGDDTLERIHDIGEFQQRLLGIQPGVRDTRYHLHIIEKSFGGDWSEDPGLDFSAFRLRSRLEVLDHSGKVADTMASTDYEHGTYLHLNPDVADAMKPAKKAAPMKVEPDPEDDVEMDLAIDNEEAYEASQQEKAGAPPLPQPPMLSRDEFERIKQDQIRLNQLSRQAQANTWKVGPADVLPPVMPSAMPPPAVFAPAAPGPAPAMTDIAQFAQLLQAATPPPAKEKPKTGGFKLFTPSEDTTSSPVQGDRDRREGRASGGEKGGKGRRGFREFDERDKERRDKEGREREGPRRGFNDRDRDRDRGKERGKERERERDYERRDKEKERDTDRRDRKEKKDKKDKKEKKGRRSGREGSDRKE